MAALPQQLRRCVCQPHLTASAVAYVVYEVAISTVAVADKGAARHEPRENLDGFDVDAVVAEPFQVQPAEIVVPDAADDAAGLTELGDLVDEDRRSTTRERANQLHRLAKTVAPLLRHDLHQDLTESCDLWHLCLSL